MTSSIFLQTEPNKIVLGTGILRRSSSPSQETPSFYLNDFFLSSETPWIIPQKVVELKTEDFLKAFSSTTSNEDTEIKVQWSQPNLKNFQATFDEIKLLIKKGILQKAVPMVFEDGKIQSYGEFLEIFAARLLKHLHANLFLYGYSDAGEGMIGLSPELLFKKCGETLSTAALAGTRATECGNASESTGSGQAGPTGEMGREGLKNQKDLSEHNFVVRDLMEKLSILGQVQSQETVAYNVGSLVHLRTPITSKLKADATFDSIVQTLHPSAALGVYPSTPEALRFLHHDDEFSPRRNFAAPFGVHFPGGDSLCIAAIRCAQWKGQDIRIGSGCGIVEESNFESECNELQIKRESIKGKLFHLL